MFLGQHYVAPSVWPSSQSPVAEKKKTIPARGSWNTVWAEAVREVQGRDRDTDQLVAAWRR